MKRKIAIDCRCFVFHGGIARYLDNILFNILSLDTHNIYYLICPQYFDILNKYKKISNVIIVNLNIKNDFFYKFVSINTFLNKEKINIYWTPTQDSLLWKNKNLKIVLSVHDVWFEHHRNWFTYKVRLMSLLGIYKMFFCNADYIFYDSNFTKKDAEDTYRASKPSTITYLGASNVFKKLNKESAKKYVFNTFDISQPYIFYMDALRYENLFKAFSIFISQSKNKDVTLVCLLHSSNVGIFDCARKYNINGSIVWIENRVSDLDLNNLYAGADFFISPSIYEGFGLTPLESLQSGTPILISNTTCLPEIFKNGAVYCNPFDYVDISNKMNILYKNQSVKTSTLSNAGKLFEIYNWKNVATSILKVFNSL